MMPEVLFLTHLTPIKKRTKLRQSLIELWWYAIHQQTYQNFKLLIVSEDKIETLFQNKIQNILWLQIKDKNNIRSELEKLYESKEVIDFIMKSEYTIKLDDDDIISPTIVQNTIHKNFDICYDEWHTFYDICSGRITQQKRPWIASTCIHKTSCVFSKHTDNEKENIYTNSIMYTDHSQVWHRFYSNKNKWITSPQHPVYMRVLSPTSKTAASPKPIRKFEDIDFKAYHTYLKTFGYWKPAPTHDFDDYLSLLSEVWKKFSGKDHIPIRGIDPIHQWLDKLKQYVRKKTGTLF